MTISSLFTSIRATDRAQLILVSTTLTSFFTGFLLGIYSIRGYLISPELHKEREANYADPVESEESDVDEDDTILDHAPNWSNGEEADRKQGLRAVQAPPRELKEKVVKEAKDVKKEAAREKEMGNPGEECKLVLVVRTDLGMTKGKIAAQCGHATLACYKSLMSEAQKKPNGQAAKLLKRWEQRGQAKIAVQTKSQDEMLELMGKARSLGVTAEVIADAGRTQIESGSLTVLGVGPAPKSVVDGITGHLKLL
ncbi:peptidyl-tRNA hydrolase PTH2-domain-containing protein [Coniochaeta sp. 2T2.1]|nr:peptidyl-tRNA hydrolase PTH2-domain-containing protein [Coniochaeta sp. 2T2.1]